MRISRHGFLRMGTWPIIAGGYVLDTMLCTAMHIQKQYIKKKRQNEENAESQNQTCKMNAHQVVK